jgi:hypothetical protein
MQFGSGVDLGVRLGVGVRTGVVRGVGCGVRTGVGSGVLSGVRRGVAIAVGVGVGSTIRLELSTDADGEGVGYGVGVSIGVAELIFGTELRDVRPPTPAIQKAAPIPIIPKIAAAISPATQNRIGARVAGFGGLASGTASPFEKTSVFRLETESAVSFLCRSSTSIDGSVMKAGVGTGSS